MIGGTRQRTHLLKLGEERFFQYIRIAKSMNLEPR